MLRRYNEISERLCYSYDEELMDELGRLQEQLDHRDAWDLDTQLDQAMDALLLQQPDLLAGTRRGPHHAQVMRLHRRLACGEDVRLPSGAEAFAGRPWLN